MRSFDRVAKVYDATRALPQEVMSAVVDAVAQELDGSARVLDAGVGTGRLAGPLRRRGLNVVGLDGSAGMLAEAKKKSLDNLVRGDLTRMPFGDGAFDSCLMVHVLHLLDRPSELISELTRVCTSRVVTVVDEGNEERAREEYVRLRTEAGFPWRETSERRLKAMVTPSLLRPVASFVSVAEADDDIEYLRNRLSSVTWDLPEGIHHDIIRRLRSSMGGSSSRFTTTVILVAWDVGLLRSQKLPT
jgi:ubiquinone/menaquinone biosynthesis C-methylase UbiE